MGLDMYAMTTRERPNAAHGFKVEQAEQIHCWRKHPNLHGWMENLYFEKGGQETFNCVPLVLLLEDLDRLEADIKAGDLPDTSGFFFGASDGSEFEDDLAFVAKARASIVDGLTVFYDSWW